MTMSEFWWRGWEPDGFALGAGAFLALGYWGLVRKGGAAAARPLGWAKKGLFLLGMGLFVLAEVSPLGVLARHYLFSAHMAQHLLLLLVVPPILLLALPPSDRGAGPAGEPVRLSRWTSLRWLAGVGAMWVWHAPALCDAASSSAGWYRVQMVSLLACGFVFWWPIVGPRHRQHLPPLTGAVYLFSACLGCTLLGIYLTFAPATVCSIYVHPVDRWGILPLLRQTWGLTLAQDQQLGGLLMWVPACLIYLTGILGLLGRWYRAPDWPAASGQEPFKAPVRRSL